MLRLLNFLYLDLDYGVALVQQGGVNILGTVSHSIITFGQNKSQLYCYTWFSSLWLNLTANLLTASYTVSPVSE